MGNAFYVILGGNLAGAAFSVNGTQFAPLGGDTSSGISATEQPTQWESSDSYTAKNFGVNLSQNAYVTTANFRLRIGSSNGMLAISIGSAGTGWLSDSSHSDSIASTNLINMSFVATTAGTTCTLRQLSLEMDGASALYETAAAAFSPSTQNLFLSVQGGCTTVFNGKLEARANFYIGAAGSLAFLSINLSATTAQTWTCKSRIGAGNGAQTVTISSSSVAGIYRDSSHSDAVVAGNLVDTSFTETGTFSGACTGSSYQFTPTTVGQQDFAGSCSDSGNSWSAGTTLFAAWGGFLTTGNATESQTQVELPVAITASLLRVLLPATTLCSVTTTMRVGGSSKTGTTSTALATTNPGWVVDNSHSDSIAAAALFDLQVVTGAGSSTSFSQTGLTAAVPPAAVNVNISQVTATGAARGLTPDPGGQATRATAAGRANALALKVDITAARATSPAAAHAVTANPAPPTAGRVTASGVARAPAITVGANAVRATSAAAARGTRGTQGVGAARATAVGTARAPVPKVSVIAARATAGGVARGTSGAGATTAARATSAAVARAVSLSVEAFIRRASAFGDARPIFLEPPVYFPGVSIMSSRAVAAIGLMDDDPVLGIGRLFPTGPQPHSIEVVAPRATAACRAATVQTTFDVRVVAPRVTSVCRAMPVIAA